MIKKILIIMSILLIVNTNITPLHANEKEIDKLYVITSEDYEAALEEETLIINNQENFVIIKDEITEENIAKIRSANKFYIFGEYDGMIEKLTAEENYDGNVFGYNRYEVAAAHSLEDTSKDIIIVNGSSVADAITGLQLAIAQDKNLLIVEEKGIPKFTGKYLAEFGEGKSLTFVEGSLKIDTKKRNQLLAIAGNEKYEIDKSQVSKEIEIKENETRITIKIPKGLSIKKVDERIMNSLKTSAKRIIDNMSNKKDSSKKDRIVNINLDEAVVDKNKTINNDKIENYSYLNITNANIYEGNSEDSPLEIITIKKPRVKLSDSNELAQVFIKQLLTYKGWDYSQARRWETGYADCSSIIERAMLDSGITSYSTNLVTSTIPGDPRFMEIPFNQIMPGDILWKDGHTEVYMGGDATFGAFQPGMLAGYSYQISRFHRAFRLTGL